MPPPERGLARKERKSRVPLQKATVTETAQERPREANETLDRGILEKIQKCLNRAAHSSSTESEAKAALFIAHKMMTQYNVTQADLLASEPDKSKAQYVGRSVVSIRHTDSSKRVTKESFVGKVATAMCTFFDCKCFSTDYGSSIRWTFYGIAENTVAAASAFEMAHNKILDWACSYKGGSPTFSYRIGVADGLVAMANRKKKRELEEVRRKELDVVAARAAGRQQQLDRIHTLPAIDIDPVGAEAENTFCDGLFLDDSDSLFELFVMHDSSDRDGEADFNENDKSAMDIMRDVDDNTETAIKQESYRISDLASIHLSSAERKLSAASSAPISNEHAVPSPWASEMQLTRFRATSEQVADDFIEKNNIKLYRQRSRPVAARDTHAYRQGWKDSSKIDLRQRRLE
ncbi:hypothetical protein V6Z88_003737 [Aspergillus fumigatus]|nr:hypothetical protein KXX44_008442 [Aspergillus fumigatus]KAH1838671.1 hypothetical protein KXX55_005454 [Aspergillus fumigatus]KAH2441606.1 hypothetical protein KXV83_004316 [Aspergillus fumigatus]KAH2976656.1 hypothetical protein KXW58_006661 [Aspergillus fumigatus]KAH3034966.1 hypothetical protein KXW01_005901 [Aspergillus fumigatus]